jgi:hypothetical protein
MKKASAPAQSAWQTNPFLAALQLACLGQYKAVHPAPPAAVEGESFGQVDVVAIGLDALLTDTLHRARGLEAEQSRLAGELGEKIGLPITPSTMRTLKEIVGIPEEVAAQFALYLETSEKMEAARRQIGILQPLRDNYVGATVEHFFQYANPQFGPDGVVVGTRLEVERPLALPIGHAAMQVGRTLVLIIAGEGCPEATADPTALVPFPITSGAARQIAEEAARAANYASAGTVEDAVLRRVAAHANSLLGAAVHAGPVSVLSMANSIEELQVAAGASGLAQRLFWHLAEEHQPELAGKRICLGPDWTLREKPAKSLLGSLLSFFGADDDDADGEGIFGGLRRFADHLPNCGRDSCPIHGAQNRRGAPAAAGA